MNKQSRRSKRTSAGDSSLQGKGEDREPQQQGGNAEERVRHLEKQNEALKRELEELKSQSGDVTPTSVDDPHRLQTLQEQVVELKKKLTSQSQHSTQKQKNGEGGRILQDEIQGLKAQKVQLLCKMKLESVQFRLSKALLEKQVLQLKKEQRRSEYEVRKLLALNEKQKLVLKRKTEEASLAAKRLNQLLESRKASSRRASGLAATSGNSFGTQAIEIELKVAARVENIRAEYERQMEEMVDEVKKFEEEAETLRQENLRCLLEEKEVDCAVRDSELRDLKEEVARLGNLVSQLGMPKAFVVTKKPQVDPAKFSACSGSGGGSSGELLDMYTTESECSGGNVASKQNSGHGACCSCSRKSLCKTLKCECRAAGGCCGPRCGCIASKCANRKITSISKEDSQQPEVPGNLVHSSGNSEVGKDGVTSQPAETVNDCGRRRRKPLSEIGNGNALVSSSPTKPGRKLKGKKPATQVDAAENAEGQKGRHGGRYPYEVNKVFAVGSSGQKTFQAL